MSPDICPRCHGRGKCEIITSRPGFGVTVKTRVIPCPDCGSPSRSDLDELAAFEAWVATKYEAPSFIIPAVLVAIVVVVFFVSWLVAK